MNDNPHNNNKKTNKGKESYPPELLSKALFSLTMRQDPSTKTIGIPLDVLAKKTDGESLLKAIKILDANLKERGFELITYKYKGKEYLASRLKNPSFSLLTEKDYNVLALIIYFIETQKSKRNNDKETNDLKNKKEEKKETKFEASVKRLDLEEFCQKTDIEVKNYLRERLPVLETMGYIVRTNTRPITYSYGPRILLEIPEKTRVTIVEAIKNQLLMA